MNGGLLLMNGVCTPHEWWPTPHEWCVYSS